MPDEAKTGQSTKFQQALTAAVSGDVRFDDITCALYSTDASVYQMIPSAVVIPKSRSDVLAVLRVCNEFGFSITARGGGTSQAGQAIGRGVQLDFSKHLRRVLSFEPESFRVRVEPGIVLDELNAFLKPYGLTLPLDISTSDRATIGGMIANNSAGTRSVVYGKTIDYVLSLTALLSDGSVVELTELDGRQFEALGNNKDFAGTCYKAVHRLAREHQSEIEQRYPKILRRVGGYNLDEFAPGRPSYNMSQMLVGSEGTLALILDATLRLVRPPKHRAMCVVQFRGLLESLAATPLILNFQPSAVELVDRFILDSTRGKSEFEPLRDFIRDDPAAVLFVEFFGDSPQACQDRVLQLEDALKLAGSGYYVYRAFEPSAQARLWKLRQAALGLSMSEFGDAKAISFVEDTAVAPEKLRDYIERFIQILETHDTRAGFYAHASVGLLHVRPVVNLKTVDGVAKFTQIAERVSDLVLEFGGAISGEHGDGLVRSPFQKKMYGSELYQAFCELKQTFDPKGIFNPGKIVEAPVMADNLRFGPRYETREVTTAFDFSDFGGLSRAAEQCGGVGACRKTTSGTMCPSYMATRSEIDSTRGRANTLRLAISGQLKGIDWKDPALYPVLDLCLECKACKTECPTGVDLARIKSEFLHQYRLNYGASWRSRLLSNVEQLSLWGQRIAPVSNWITGSHLFRWLTEALFGLDRRRIPPAYARQSFLDWWEASRSRFSEKRNGSDRQLVLFADTFNNFHEPEVPIAVAELALRYGWGVSVPRRVCCGRPLISKGWLDDARQNAERVTLALRPYAEQRIPIVFCEPSCYSAVRDDHPLLLRGVRQADARMVAENCWTFEEWANRAVVQVTGEPGTTSESKKAPERVLLHGHCHQKALTGVTSALQLMKRVSTGDVIDLDAGCCGMAGSFGYEREHYEISRLIGERKLFPAIRSEAADVPIVAAGFSCRHQIEHFVGRRAMHPAILCRSALVPF